MRVTWWAAACGCVAGLASAAPLAAQEAERLPSGVQYRVILRTPPPKQLVGVLSRDDGRSLILTAADGSRPQVVNWSNVLRVERQVPDGAGQPSVAGGVVRGALVGLLAGAVAAVAISVSTSGDDSTELSGTGAAAGILLPVTTLLGGVIGGAAAAGGRTQYENVSLPPHAGVRIEAIPSDRP